jgi:L-2-hydroxyglutarate oxidase
MTFDYAIIGGGIVGLASAMALKRRFPSAEIVLLEKEDRCALHQTGRNSGVIHSGIYYEPGSFKARFAKAGADSMVRFCEQYEIPHEVCGKVIVATRKEELPVLDRLYKRGIENGLPVERVLPEAVREMEPHVQSVGGIKVPTTGITDYGRVADTMARLFVDGGGEIRMGSEVRAFARSGSKVILETASGKIEARFVINCAGLHSDRVARKAGAHPEARIVPFRGEYFELVPERRHLVKSLIYPVPNPDFPFLGVHFTRMIDGSVHAGPNAVLAFKREGYSKADFNFRDVWETVSFGGFWRLAARHFGEGTKEIHRSLSKAAFVRSLQRLIPEVKAADLVPCKAGVRAQALRQGGALVDDFLFKSDPGFLHVCNAPSPAATASLEIGRSVAEQVPCPQNQAAVEV